MEPTHTPVIKFGHHIIHVNLYTYLKEPLFLLAQDGRRLQKAGCGVTFTQNFLCTVPRTNSDHVGRCAPFGVDAKTCFIIWLMQQLFPHYSA